MHSKKSFKKKGNLQIRSVNLSVKVSFRSVKSKWIIIAYKYQTSRNHHRAMHQSPCHLEPIN